MRSPTAFITVTCDKCGCEEQVELTTTARGYDERDVDETLKSEGWTIDGQDLCPDCAEEADRDPADAEDDYRYMALHQIGGGLIE